MASAFGYGSVQQMVDSWEQRISMSPQFQADNFGTNATPVVPRWRGGLRRALRFDLAKSGKLALTKPPAGGAVRGVVSDIGDGTASLRGSCRVWTSGREFC
jgi:hypothetical protein